MPRSLCVVSPGRLAVAPDGRVQIDPKTAAGMMRYAATWPDEVHFVARRGSVDARSQPFDWPQPQQLGFNVSIEDDIDASIRRIGPAMLLAPLELENAGLLSHGARTALVADYPLRVRWENARIDPRLGLVDRLRTAAGLSHRGIALRRMIRKADGLQCNGPDTFATYGKYSARPLLYLDTRATESDVALASATPKRPESTLRLAFSGRWIEQKGVLDAVEAVQRLHADGVAVHLTLLGGGSLEGRLRSIHHPAISVRGRLDFAKEWLPFVREQVDVMVLPHPQGDSASTFLESMSSGSPVAGYANRYWRQLHTESNGGWLTRRADVGALTERLAALASDPSQIARARDDGLAYGRVHTFEAEFDRRVEHLLSLR